MSENDQDTMAVEDRLRSSLSSLASTTAVAPDGWDAIESRVERRRRRRTFGWAVGGPAVALAAVALFVAVLPAGDKEPSVVAGPGEPAAPARYAPQGPRPDTYVLQGVEIGGTGEIPAGASSIRVYGHRAADGVSLDKVLMVMTAGSTADADELRTVAPGGTGPRCPYPGASCIGIPTTEATLRGQRMIVGKYPMASSVVWDEPGGPTVGVTERGMSEDDLYAVVNEIQIQDGRAVAATLPAGFTAIHAGVWPSLPGQLSPDVVTQHWVNGPAELTLEVHQGPGVTLDTRAWLLHEASVTNVNGAPALYGNAQAGTETTLVWSPKAGVVLAVSAAGGPDVPLVERSEERLRSFAENVQPITEEAWDQLVGAGPVASSPMPTAVPATAGEATAIASGRVDGKDWTLTHQESTTGASGCFQVELSTGMAGICDLDLAGPKEVGTPYFLGNLTTDGTLSFVVATVGTSVSSVGVTWSGESRDGSSAGTGAQIVDVNGNLRVVVIPVADWSRSRPAFISGLDADGNDLNRQSVAEANPCWPTCNEPSRPSPTTAPPPTTAG